MELREKPITSKAAEELMNFSVEKLL